MIRYSTGFDPDGDAETEQAGETPRREHKARNKG
jgi:hypothetical protein